MDELIIQVLSGTATPSQAERVHGWRAESAENEAYFRSIQGLWQATEPATLAHVSEPVDPALIVAASDERRKEQDDPKVAPLAGRRPVLGRKVTRWGVAAAAAVAAVALGVRLTGPAAVPQPTAIYVADGGAARSVGLADGSFVRLAAGSALEVWETEPERRVTLSGRAFFAVVRDEGRPFIVAAGASETRVLGTRFEIAEEGADVRTVVVDGLVAVSNDHGAIEVPAGSVARVATNTAPSVEAADDVYALLDWPEGILLFQGTPLAQVAEEVSRHFNRIVEVQGERLPSLRISGTFEGVAFEEVVLALCDAAGARCTLTQDGARIQPRP